MDSHASDYENINDGNIQSPMGSRMYMRDMNILTINEVPNGTQYRVLTF